MAGTREDLAKLQVSYNNTIASARTSKEIDSFVKSEIVNKIRRESELISEIEEYRLPEVTALICNSSPTLIWEKYKKYSFVLPLYRTVKREDILSTFELDVDVFQEYIVPYLDTYLIKEFTQAEHELNENVRKNGITCKEYYQKIEQYEKDIIAQQELLQLEKDELEKMTPVMAGTESKNADIQENIEKQANITSQFQIEENYEANNNMADLDEKDPVSIQKARLKKIKKKITELTKKKIEITDQLQILEKVMDEEYPQMDSVESYMEYVYCFKQSYENDLHMRRSRCFDHIKNSNLKKETELIDMILRGEVDNTIIEDFYGKKNAIENIFVILESGQFSSREMKIIVSMLEIKMLTVKEDCFVKYFSKHSDLLCEYLVTYFKNDIDELCSDYAYQILFKLAIMQEMVSDFNQHDNLWDEIEDKSIWKYVAEYIDDELILARIVSDIRGRVLRSFLEYLDESEINMPSFIQALSKQRNVNSDLIFRIVQNYDKKLSRANREARRANKRLEIHENAGAAKVFTAMYEPMEKLETLTIDIKKFDGEIKKKVIAEQLIECVNKFRKGLEDLEVFPMEEFDNWKYQKNVEYDNELHRYEDGNVKGRGNVNVKTLGYRYTTADSSGSGASQEYVEYAKVLPTKE